MNDGRVRFTIVEGEMGSWECTYTQPGPYKVSAISKRNNNICQYIANRSLLKQDSRNATTTFGSGRFATFTECKPKPHVS